jgi:hypothetical protein
MLDIEYRVHTTEAFFSHTLCRDLNHSNIETKIFSFYWIKKPALYNPPNKIHQVFIYQWKTSHVVVKQKAGKKRKL